MHIFQVTTFADRPGYQRVSSTLWKQREDYCASLIQKAWKFHKLRNTESATAEEPHTGDEEEESCSLSLPAAAAKAATAGLAASTASGAVVKLPPIDRKHLIEVRSADGDDEDDEQAVVGEAAAAARERRGDDESEKKK